MFVKICGITRAEDADAAVTLGADAIGFVFWPASPRFIDPSRAGEIAARVPASVTKVGLFVNQSANYINETVRVAGLTAIQLHGDETPEDALQLSLPVIKALTLDAEPFDAWPMEMMVLLDAHDPVQRGGTGQTIDWAAAARVAERRRTILAGGLTPENVADAVNRVRPFGIDVSSGVESSPGVKDHARLRALFEAVR